MLGNILLILDPEKHQVGHLGVELAAEHIELTLKDVDQLG